MQTWLQSPQYGMSFNKNGLRVEIFESLQGKELLEDALEAD